MSRWISYAMACALLVSGCSASGPILVDPDTAPPGPSSSGTETDAGTISSASGDAGAIEPLVAADGELRIAVVGEVVTDPLVASVVRPTDMIALDLLYDGLTAWDDDEATWRMALASTMSSSGDGLVWTIDLGHRTFNDGSAVTAVDVVRSLDRVRTSEGTLAAARLEMVSSIAAIDETSIEIALTSPFALLPALLSSPVFGIVPDGPADGSVGSGPMVRETADLLTAREGADHIDVRFVPVRDELDAVDLQGQGAIDLTFVSSKFDGPVDETHESFVEAHYAFNVRSDALGDVAIRQAIADAVGRSALSRTGFSGAALAIDRLVPAALACVDPCGGAVISAHEVAELSVVYVADDTGREDRLARDLVAQLRTAGVEATATGYELDVFIEVVGRGDFDLVRTGWVGLFGSPDSQLGPYTSVSPDNITGYSNPDFDALVASARASGDPQACADAGTALSGEAVVLPFARLQVRALVSDRVEGLELRADATFDVSALRLG